MTETRIGHGYDIHRFTDEFLRTKPLVLAGVTLPDELSLLAHSDGDLILHALCDALLGAAGAGDIGQHFPDTDPNLAGVSSAKLLAQVMRLLARENFFIGNIDITVIAQVPKLAPHRQSFLDSLSGLLNIDISRINIKATTTEGLGAIGNKEGIACHAVVLLVGKV